jgi:hypothetical protein
VYNWVDCLIAPFSVAKKNIVATAKQLFDYLFYIPVLRDLFG